MGVQDFDPAVQEAINRRQSPELTEACIHTARQAGFQSISLDLIYGLPRQQPVNFHQTLDQVLALDPDRISLFNFAYMPERLRHQKALPAADLPGPETKLDLFILAWTRLRAAGYQHIGMDHFAKESDPLWQALQNHSLQRNFQGYTTHAGCDLHAFGSSSISSFGRVYAQNLKNPRDYEAALGRNLRPLWRGLLLNKEDLLRREIIMELMCHFSLDWTALGQRHDLDPAQHFASEWEALKELEDEGLLRCSDQSLQILPLGQLVIRNICLIFDSAARHSTPARSSAPTHSRSL
ncbi:MAG: coproporphyrinogen dehydrogenase [Blastochloris sp.]|nr:coproporphyrinogen dehydrogenase [Blastochloris sp.]